MKWLKWLKLYLKKWERTLTVPNIIIVFLLVSLIGILVWGLITGRPDLDAKSLKELIEDAGKTFGS